MAHDQQVYTPEEIAAFREQKRAAIIDAEAASRGRYQLHPRIMAMRADMLAGVLAYAKREAIEISDHAQFLERWVAGEAMDADMSPGCRALLRRAN